MEMCLINNFNTFSIMKKKMEMCLINNVNTFSIMKENLLLLIVLFTKKIQTCQLYKGF